MNFLVDNQLPPVLARWLTKHGHTGKHVLDFDLDEAPDAAVWSHALDPGRDRQFDDRGG